jgi:molybdopterin-guanine dinucleotide biosynthesis protein A
MSPKRRGPEPHPALAGAILAGGQASRFGGAPKGLAEVGGVRVLDRVAAALRAVPCDDLLLIANAPDAATWLPGARVVRDRRPGLGALGGLHAALSQARGPVLVVAWDMPFVPTALLAALAAAVHAGAPAAVPSGPHGPEPLCACYGPSCLTIVERLLDAGERRASALAEAAQAIPLGTDEVARFGDPATMFTNVNTPDDLSLAERLTGQS